MIKISLYNLSLTHVTTVSDFEDNYSTHTSCITEAERYEKSVYRGGKDKKKKNPQEAWMDLIVSASSSAPVSIRRYMGMLASLDNVPRKPKQFRNFTANSLNLKGKQASDIVDSLWNYLAQLRDKDQETKKKEEEEQKRQKEQAEAQIKSSDEKEKPPVSDNGKEFDTKRTNGKDKVTPKKVEKAMKKVLKKAPSRTMKLKELRRAVQNYLECGNSEKKRLKEVLGDQIKVNIDGIKVDGKLVTLR